jgi:hypothetical protein
MRRQNSDLRSRTIADLLTIRTNDTQRKRILTLEVTIACLKRASRTQVQNQEALNLHVQSFHRAIQKHCGPEYCFADPKQSFPKRNGVLNVIDSRAQESQTIDASAIIDDSSRSLLSIVVYSFHHRSLFFSTGCRRMVLRRPG